MEVHKADASTEKVVIIDKRGITPLQGFLLGALVAVLVLAFFGYLQFSDYAELLRAYNYK